MAVVVDCEREAFDIYLGRGEEPGGAGVSPWAIPAEIVLRSRAQVAADYRVWLWREICAERIDLAQLAGLHGKVFGVGTESEGWHLGVLESASMWALGEQARRLAMRVGVLFGRPERP
jgi:hypothetical protein